MRPHGLCAQPALQCITHARALAFVPLFVCLCAQRNRVDGLEYQLHAVRAQTGSAAAAAQASAQELQRRIQQLERELEAQQTQAAARDVQVGGALLPEVHRWVQGRGVPGAGMPGSARCRWRGGWSVSELCV